MKKLTVAGVLLASFIFGACPLLAGTGGEVIFQAMQDELDRNISQLVLEDMERPYYLSYTVDDIQEVIVQATLGTLASSRPNRSRYVTIDLRIGDPTLDNANFIDGFYGTGPDYSVVAVDDDYDALRNRIYLATDRAYKSALKAISKKRAYLQTRVIKDRPADFIVQKATTYADRPEEFDLDRKQFEDLARTASEVFRAYPSIISSEVKVTAFVANQYFINSTGSRVLRADRLYVIEVFTGGKTGEGEDLGNADRLTMTTGEDVPDAAALAAWARQHAEQTVSLLAAKELEEYSGPVILDGDAAGEFFRQVFVKHITNAPAPTYADDRMASSADEPKLADKIRRRVLPDFFDVYDDPTSGQVDGLAVVGTYPVDDAGGVPQRIQLVEKGRLTNIPIGTAPTKKITEPNGHARGAVSKGVTAKAANVIFVSQNTASFAKMKQTMLAMCADYDLEYGLVITRLEDLNAPRPGFSFPGGLSTNESALTPPLAGYKVYADGREELVRNLEFSNVTVRTLRDILQSGDRQHAYHYLIGDDCEMPASIVCPAVLVEEMELKKTEAKTKKPPVLPSPLTEN